MMQLPSSGFEPAPFGGTWLVQPTREDRGTMFGRSTSASATRWVADAPAFTPSAAGEAIIDVRMAAATPDLSIST